MKRIAKHLILSVLIFGALLSEGNAQYAAFRFTHLSPENGLPQLGFSYIVTDSRGYVWFDVSEGICRFDGYEYKIYRYAAALGDKAYSTSVRMLYPDRRGNIWIAFAPGGLCRFNIRTEAFSQYSYEPLSENGLCNESITCFYEDRENRLWVGSGKGLMRYDPYKDEFVRFRSRNLGWKGIEDQYITCMLHDTQNNFWVGTQEGLYLVSFNHLTVKQFDNVTGDPHCISSGSIRKLITDREGNLWVSTGFGVNRLLNPPKNGVASENLRFRRFWEFGDTPAARITDVKDLLADRRGNIWVSGPAGVARIYAWAGVEAQSDFFPVPRLIEGNLSRSYADNIFEDSRGHIWVSCVSEKIRLFCYDPATGSMHRLTDPSFSVENVGEIRISQMIEDPSGSVWFSTVKKGIFLCDIYRKAFETIQFIPSDANSLINNDVYQIFEAPDSTLWVSTNRGLSAYSPQTGRWTHYMPDASDPQSPASSFFGGLGRQEDGTMWVGYYDNKVSRFNPATGRFVNYLHLNGNTVFLPWSVRRIYIDPDDNVWFATSTHSLAKNTGEVNTFYYYPLHAAFDSSRVEAVVDIASGSTGQLRVVAVHDVVLFDSRSGRYVKHFFRKTDVKNAHMPRENFNCIHNDLSDSSFWVGSSAGLYHLEEKSGILTVYDEAHGLCNNTVRCILEDGQNRLWISTDRGLSCFDKKTATFTNYDVADGLSDNEFVGTAGVRARDGKLYFGSRNGITTFYPDRIVPNQIQPRVVINGLRLFNRAVNPGDTVNRRVLLRNALSNGDTLVLAWKENDFSIGFTALHFAAPLHNKYMYRLEDYDKDWKVASSDARMAAYTNLPPGNYLFRVRGANSDGIWSATEATLYIEILPPWWKTFWFKILMLLAFGAGMVLIVRIRTWRLEEIRRTLEREVDSRTSELNEANKQLRERQEEIVIQNEHLEQSNEELRQQKEQIKQMAEKLHEADQLKLRIFTNISHEFRTPLTLILGPVERLIALGSRLSWSNAADQLRLLHRSANRLLKLINEILDIRKIDQRALMLHPESADIVGFVRNHAEAFRGMADELQIDLRYETDVERLECDFDPDKVEKILDNLLSNAFKFTPNSGKISVSVQGDDNRVHIAVADTGTGIAPEEQKHIFERFYQSEDKGFRRVSGSGIGLSFARQLVEMHGGSISVESLPGCGSCFRVVLPLRQSDSSALVNHAVPIRHDISEENLIAGGQLSDYLILVVEDNSDMRAYIRDGLFAHFRVIEAADGVEGLRKALSEQPDLVLSDIMMPGIDGLDLCSRLKSDPLTSHIPIVLLTAKASDASTIEGLQSGADDYLTKPFNDHILLLKIRNILAARQRMREKFSKTLDTRVEDYATTETDQRFLEKAIEIVERNISQEEFNNDWLIQHLGMSKSQVYRKLKALTDQSLSEFVRSIRLKKAATLLLTRQYSIAEVSYMVGFKNPPQLSSAFAAYFGMSPSKFIEIQDVK